uniref:U3 small nucleolar RNA-associated protein 20 N-terminal domain-containing protein n=1 Tax=Panagrolaimus sp. JU765 TaxID=591449 RepID=A0AC34R7K3_9BILA
MKPVSKVSKEGNTFKWIPFSEQVSKVNTGTVTAKLRFSDADLNNETYFFAAILDCNEKDYGDDYRSFLDDIPCDELASYAQLLHYKDVIFEALNEHLGVEGSTAYPSLLTVSIAFIRDLKDDFLPHLWTFFDTVIALIGRNSGNVEVLQTAFVVLANIFQMHWKSIVSSLRKSFARFVPLFGHSSKYIRRFAAEGFAYLLRKSSAIPKLCQFLYEQAVESESKHVKDGVTSLLFNGIKGVHKKFQSRTGELLTDFIQSALDLEDEDQKEMAHYILINVMHMCCDWTTSKDSKAIIDVLLNLTKLQIDRNLVPNINFLCGLIFVWVTEKNGKLLTQELELFNILKLVASNPKISQLDLSFLDLVSNVLNHYSEKFTDPNAVRQLIFGTSKNILQQINQNSIEAVFSFFQNVLVLSIFDIWCIGSVADIIQLILDSENFEDAFLEPILKFFSVYVCKRRPFSDGKPDARKIFFDSSKFIGFKKVIVDKIKHLNDDFDNMAVHAMVVYPWIWRSSDKVEGLKEVESLLQKLIAKKSPTYQDSLMVYLVVYNLCLLDVNYLTRTPLCNVFSFLENYNVMDEVVLRTAYLLISSSTELMNCDPLQELEKLVSILNPGLFFPSGVIRTLILKIYLLFDSKLTHGEEVDGKFVTAESALEILLKAEQTPADFHCHGQRGNYLRMLPRLCLNKMLPKNCSLEMQKIPLQVMFAQFFENFTLLWPQVHEIIVDYAKTSDFQYFWDVYQNFFNFVKTKLNIVEEDGNNLEVFDFVCRPRGNYSTVRIQLFKMLLNIPDVARKAGDFVVETFIDVYEHEFCPVYFKNDRKVNLLKKDESEDVEMETEMVEDEAENDDADNDVEMETEMVEDEAENDDADNDVEEEHEIKKPAQNRKVSKKSTTMPVLKCLLELFAKMKNPTTFKEESRLRTIYESFLTSNILELQHAAFQCILTYQYPFLNPYANLFVDLFDKKKFSDGLLRFSIDDTNSSIKEEHRMQLMPYLMKILHGHLIMKGDAKALTKKIMSYLAGSKSSELELFIDEIFGSFIDFLGMKKDVNEQTPTQFFELLNSNYDPTNMVPPRRLNRLVYFTF